VASLVLLICEGEYTLEGNVVSQDLPKKESIR
jgi:hypothetical protein